MSKIKIKSVLHSENNVHVFNGNAVKNKNKITYIDNNIKTVIIFDDIITIKRRYDYELILNFKENEILKGFYLTDFGKIDLEVQTNLLKQNENSIHIEYTLLNDHKKIEDFIFNLEYSIDT